MIIFVLRHADRSATLSDGRSSSGMARARFLARMLSESGVSVAYCSDALRTQETLVPLKEILGDALTIKKVSATGPGGLEAHVETIVAGLKELPDGVIAVVVSHSNTIGPIIEGLGEAVLLRLPKMNLTRFLFYLVQRMRLKYCCVCVMAVSTVMARLPCAGAHLHLGHASFLPEKRKSSYVDGIEKVSI